MKQPAVDGVRDGHVDQGVIAAVGDHAAESDRAGFAAAADTLHIKTDAGQAHFRIHALKAAADAIRVILVDDAGVVGRRTHRAIGKNIQGPHDITDHIGIKIRLCVGKVGSPQHDGVACPVRCDNPCVNGLGVTDDPPGARNSVENVDAIIKGVANVYIGTAGEQGNSQSAAVTVRRNLGGVNRGCPG